eukprot:605961-Amorphochlora_amoeboformis.AAC.2
MPIILTLGGRRERGEGESSRPFPSSRAFIAGTSIATTCTRKRDPVSTRQEVVVGADLFGDEIEAGLWGGFGGGVRQRSEIGGVPDGPGEPGGSGNRHGDEPCDGHQSGGDGRS